MPHRDARQEEAVPAGGHRHFGGGSPTLTMPRREGAPGGQAAAQQGQRRAEGQGGFQAAAAARGKANLTKGQVSNLGMKAQERKRQAGGYWQRLRALKKQGPGQPQRQQSPARRVELKRQR